MARPVCISRSLAPRRSGWALADAMTVAQAIRKAERILPGKVAPEGELDPRWQAIVDVSEHIRQHPDEVWHFTRKWAAHANDDLRMAVATCLLEHLLEHQFDRLFPLVSEACRESSRFADTLSHCSAFGQSLRPRNLTRFRSLQRDVSASSAKPLRRMAVPARGPALRRSRRGRHR
jgi:hypothetical protein